MAHSKAKVCGSVYTLHKKQQERCADRVWDETGFELKPECQLTRGAQYRGLRSCKKGHRWYKPAERHRDAAGTAMEQTTWVQGANAVDLFQFAEAFLAVVHALPPICKQTWRASMESIAQALPKTPNSRFLGKISNAQSAACASRFNTERA